MSLFSKYRKLFSLISLFLLLIQCGGSAGTSSTPSDNGTDVDGGDSGGTGTTGRPLSNIAISSTNDSTHVALMVSDEGEALTTINDSSGIVTGAIWRDADSAEVTVLIDENGYPTRVNLGQRIGRFILFVRFTKKNWLG